VSRAAAIHLPDRLEHERRASRPFAAARDLLHLAIGNQAVEVEAHGVRMHAEPVGDRDDAHGGGRRPQQPQHLTAAAAGGFSD